MVAKHGKYVAPSTRESAFNCPHCGALAKQYWYNGHVKPVTDEGRLPKLFSQEDVALFEQRVRNGEFPDLKDHEKLLGLFKRWATGRLVFEKASTDYCDNIANLFVSRCFNCEEIAVWKYDSILWPHQGDAPTPNSDLPDDVLREYDEASRILNLSPRGSAAFLRVAVQRLCKHLGAKGNKIDDDIAYLVSKGLDEEIQQALDVVRVYGNDAVHPGQIDVSDDRATAETLFSLVNIIADRMISQKKRIESIYKSLPPQKLKAIEDRNNKAKKGSNP